MRYLFFLTLALVLVSVFESAVITSLPLPFSLFPLMVVLGIVLLYQRSVTFGVAWMVVGGAMAEWRGIGDWYVVASSLAALVAALLAVLIFAKRSQVALVGVAAGSALAFALVELFVTLLAGGDDLPLGHVVQQALSTFLWIVAGVVSVAWLARRAERYAGREFTLRRSYEITPLT